ncbi:MAG: hypothetical protein MUC97_15420 [Bernardetiaceae bacterium]|nr:hypothetical protein [Bernardetiaceae bacterium]
MGKFDKDGNGDKPFRKGKAFGNPGGRNADGKGGNRGFGRDKGKRGSGLKFVNEGVVEHNGKLWERNSRSTWLKRDEFKAKQEGGDDSSKRGGSDNAPKNPFEKRSFNEGDGNKPFPRGWFQP